MIQRAIALFLPSIHLSKSSLCNFSKSIQEDFYLFLGTHNSILALELLPLCVTITKNCKITEAKTVLATKEDIQKSFILHLRVKIIIIK